jgi:hypothetical protein
MPSDAGMSQSTRHLLVALEHVSRCDTTASDGPSRSRSRLQREAAGTCCALTLPVRVFSPAFSLILCGYACRVFTIPRHIALSDQHFVSRTFNAWLASIARLRRPSFDLVQHTARTELRGGNHEWAAVCGTRRRSTYRHQLARRLARRGGYSPTETAGFDDVKDPRRPRLLGQTMGGESHYQSVGKYLSCTCDRATLARDKSTRIALWTRHSVA